MNYDSGIAKLRAQKELVSIADLANCFDVHASSLERWIRHHDFPKAVPLGHRRLFRPDLVIAWAEKNLADCDDMIYIEEVLTLCAMYRETYHNAVKTKGAPGPTRREIGTGRYVYSRAEVRDWLKSLTGGFMRPLSTRDTRRKKNGKAPPDKFKALAVAR